MNDVVKTENARRTEDAHVLSIVRQALLRSLETVGALKGNAQLANWRTGVLLICEQCGFDERLGPYTLVPSSLAQEPRSRGEMLQQRDYVPREPSYRLPFDQSLRLRGSQSPTTDQPPTAPSFALSPRRGPMNAAAGVARHRLLTPRLSLESLVAVRPAPTSRASRN